MTCVMNLSRLTDLYYDLGADEGGLGSSGDGMAGEAYLSSPHFTLSPSLSAVFDSGVPGGWERPLDGTASGHAQLSSGDDAVGSGGSNPAVEESYFPTMSPDPERAGSLYASEDTEEPKKRYAPLRQGINGRHRRVYGPVKGNNTSGKRGKLSCTQCRKIRSKVSLQSSNRSNPFCGFV
jgi:hypothetical protein